MEAGKWISKLLRSWRKQNHKQWGKQSSNSLKGAGIGHSPALWQTKIA